MQHTINSIQIISQTRQIAAEAIATVLKDADGISEKEFAGRLNSELGKNKNFYEGGWYSPPPMGISVLAEEKNNLNRLLFDSLRKEKFWPSDQIITKESILFVYCSPVDKSTALVGDIGVTLYAGEDAKIQEHLKKALKVLTEVADYTEVGMEFREICDHAQKVFKENNVNNDRALLLTTGKDEFNLGHTVPFSYGEPTEDERNIIQSEDFEQVRDLISHKRVYVGPDEKFRILPTCAFTIEARLEDNDDQTCPNNFFHLIVSFENGRKVIHTNYESAKKSWGATNL